MSFEARLPHGRAPPKLRHDARYQPHGGYNNPIPYVAPLRHQNFGEDRYDNGPRRNRSNRDYGGYQDQGEGQRSGSDRRLAPNITFEDAVGDLHDTLNDAHGFYAGFKRDFDNEVSGVAAYAGAHVLGELWENKVRNVESRRDSRALDGERADNSFPKFRTMHQQLIENFDIAMTTPPSRKSRNTGRPEGPDMADHIRLVAKLKRASADIFKLTRSVTKKSSDTNALMTELEMIIAYLEKSESVWSRGRDIGNAYNQDGNEPSGEDDYAPEVGDGSTQCR